MPITPVHRRPPRAGIDRIDHAGAAFDTVAMAMHLPRRDEVIVVMLDAERRGLAIVVVSGTTEPDAVIEVVEFVTRADAHQGELHAVVVASVRPIDDAVHDRDPGDVDRWLEMSDVTEQVGIELLEWFVIGHTVNCPRDQLGEPPRW